MVMLYGAPPYTPPAVEAPYKRLPMTWEGWDGSLWDLSDPDSGLVVQRIRGLDSGPVERYTQASPGVAGARPTGYQYLERPAFWQLLVWSDQRSQEWQDRYSGLMRTFSAGRPGEWAVTRPDGSRRYLRMEQASEDASSLEEYDPALFGWSQHGINFVASEPFWRADPVRRSFAAPAPVPFFPPGGAPGFQISPGSTTGSATIDNPGDVQAWPSYRLTDTDTATLGVGGKAVVVPFAVPTGKMLVIDAAPTRRTAKMIDAPATTDDDGNPLPDDQVDDLVAAALADPSAVDRSGDLGAVAWGAVPSGSSRPLDITVTGEGAVVSVHLTPLYERALT